MIKWEKASTYNVKKVRLISFNNLCEKIKSEFQGHFNTLKDIENKIIDDKIWVLVVGEFSTGKSTLVNAIIGKDILPAWNRETSANIMQVQSSDKENIIVFFDSC